MRASSGTTFGCARQEAATQAFAKALVPEGCSGDAQSHAPDGIVPLPFPCTMWSPPTEVEHGCVMPGSAHPGAHLANP